eukprot:6214771-Pleurochrysis_carterae.AAC.3
MYDEIAISNLQALQHNLRATGFCKVADLQSTLHSSAMKRFRKTRKHQEGQMQVANAGKRTAFVSRGNHDHGYRDQSQIQSKVHSQFKCTRTCHETSTSTHRTSVQTGVRAQCAYICVGSHASHMCMSSA